MGRGVVRRGRGLLILRGGVIELAGERGRDERRRKTASKPHFQKLGAHRSLHLSPPGRTSLALAGTCARLGEEAQLSLRPRARPLPARGSPAGAMTRNDKALRATI